MKPTMLIGCEHSGILAAASHRTNIGKKRGVGGSPAKNETSGLRRYDGFNERYKAKNTARREGDLSETRHGDDIEPTLMRNKRDVWWVGSQPYKEAHFATFPPNLIRPCILAGCPVKGTVIDPFGGSGTTGQVAEEEGRNSVLIELNPDYVKLAKKRTEQTGLFT